MRSKTITISNLAGGIIKEFSNNAQIGIRGTNDTQYSNGRVCISKPGYVGHMSAMPGFTEVNASMSGYPVGGVQVSNGNCYFVTNTGGVYRLSTSDVLTQIAAPGTYVGDATYGDMWTHINNAGQEVVYISYYASTLSAWSICEMTVSTEGFITNAPFTTTPLQTNYATALHRAVVGPGNKSYILNGGYVAVYNPANTAVGQNYVPQSLYLGVGWDTKAICSYSGYVAVVGSRGNSESRLWLWDGSSTTPNFFYDIKDSQATAVINDSGDLKIFTSGKNGTTKIKIFTSGDISEDPLWERDSISVGTTPNSYSVGVFYNQIFWMTPNLGQSTVIYSQGSPNRAVYNQGVHQQATLFGNNVGTGGGLCKNVKSNRLYVGYTKTGTGNGVLAYTDLTSYSIYDTTQFTSQMYETPTKTTITRIKVFFSDWRVGSSFYPELFINNQSQEVLQIAANPAVQYSDKTDLTYYPITKSIPTVESFYFRFTYSQCAIRRIEVTYNYDESDV